MGILTWLVFGALAGWVASKIFGNDKGQGWIANIIVGIVGAMIGGFVGSLIFDIDVTGFNISSFLIAVAGALILLFGLKTVTGRAP